MIRTSALLPAIAALAAAGAASAAFQLGTTYTTSQAGDFYAVFASSTTPAGSGKLYFLSYQSSGGSPTAITSDTTIALGKSLFSNTAAQGTSVLLGAFDAGTVLHFAYRSVLPNGNGNGGGQVFTTRTDTAEDTRFFGLNAAGDLGLGSLPRISFEDNKKGTSDLDRNDMVFNIQSVAATPVPAPGAVSLAFLGVLALAARAGRN